MKRIKKYKRGITKYTKKEMKELKSTRWVAELIKTLVIAALSSLITTCILYGIRINSSGEMTGDELEKYLCNKVTKLCEEQLDATDVKVEIPYSGNFMHLSDSKVIVGYGSYNIKSKEQIGRVIVFFKKKEKNLLYDIFGIEPEYNISSAYFNTSESDKHYLEYISLEDTDYDKDGKKEILLSLRSNFADRIDTVYLLFAYCNGKWQPVKNDTDKLLSLVVESTKKKKGACIYTLGGYGMKGIKKEVNLNLNIDNYTFVDLMDRQKTYDIYGLFNNGGIYTSQNPLSGECEFCYKIPYRKSNSFDRGIIYILQRYKNGKLYFENNWNNGYPMITNDKFDFGKDSWKYWGYNGNIDGTVFYGLP